MEILIKLFFILTIVCGIALIASLVLNWVNKKTKKFALLARIFSILAMAFSTAYYFSTWSNLAFFIFSGFFWMLIVAQFAYEKRYYPE